MRSSDERGSQAPSMLFSIALILFLALPYLVKLYFLEPYPAIIMPSGHGKINIQDTMLTSSEFYFEGVRYDRVFTIEPQKLFPAIPVQYYSGIIRNNLGFLSAQEKNNDIDIDSWKYKVFPWRKNKLYATDELKSYYTKNIGEPIDSIRVVKKVIMRDIRTGALIDESVVSISTYSLR